MLSILYSKYAPDAITASVLRVGQGYEHIKPICMEDCIQQGHWEADKSGRFIFRLPQETANNLVTTDYLINRAFIYDESLQLSGDFPPDVIQLEVECCFRHWIDKVKHTSACSGLYGLCGNYLPLYLQWKQVSKLNLDLNLPRYDYAFGSLTPETQDFNNTIYKSPFDCRTWRPNSAPEQYWHSFVVERPQGMPVIAIIAHDDVLFNTDVEPKIAERLQDYSLVLAHLFGSRFGEILYFIDGELISFAAFSHIVSKGFADDRLDRLMDKILSSLEKTYYG